MKKIFTLFLLILLAFAVACGGDPAEIVSEAATRGGDVAATAAAVATDVADGPDSEEETEVVEPTEEPTEEPTAEPTPEPTEEPTEEPTAVPTEEPTVEPTEEPTAVPPSSPADMGLPVFYVHQALAATLTENGTVLDYPRINGDPNAIILVTQIQTDTQNRAEIGVRYLDSAGRWLIVNQDGSPVPADTRFNIAALETASNNLIHTATVENIMDSWTVLDHPSLNGRPNAQILVTPNANPGGGEPTYHDHSIGVWYLNDEQRWAIFNQDQTAMAEGVQFNVVALSRHPGTVLHRSTEANTTGSQTTIDVPSANDNPDAVVFAFSNYNPGGQGGVYNDHPLAVSYDADAGRWRIVNRDSGAIAIDAAFNIAVISASFTQ